jgi:hypothetical protein
MTATKPRRRPANTYAELSETIGALASSVKLDVRHVDIHNPAIADIVNTLASIQALRPALTANPAPTSPQLARALQATENAWRRMAAEFGMLTSSEVAGLLGAAPSNRNYASAKRVDGALLGVLRGKAFLYPAFQFDQDRGNVLPVIPPLIELARANGWRDDDLILWLQSPTTSFEAEDRPVDHLRTDPDAVLAAAKNAFEVRW